MIKIPKGWDKNNESRAYVSVWCVVRVERWCRFGSGWVHLVEIWIYGSQYEFGHIIQAVWFKSFQPFHFHSLCIFPQKPLPKSDEPSQRGKHEYERLPCGVSWKFCTIISTDYFVDTKKTLKHRNGLREHRESQRFCVICMIFMHFTCTITYLSHISHMRLYQLATKYGSATAKPTRGKLEKEKKNA